jgi:hypothetical protein
LPFGERIVTVRALMERLLTPALVPIDQTQPAL